MKRWHNQRGMTAIGWLLVLGLIGFFTLITLRLLPMYLEYAKVVSVLESLENEADITQKTRGEIIEIITRRFDVNDVKTVDPKIVKVAKDRGKMTLGMEYERREHVIGNIDVVGHFEKQVEVNGH